MLITFEPADEVWWGKNLVKLTQGRATTGELLILADELGGSEEGVWLNSQRKKGNKTGVIDLIRLPDGEFVTKRRDLPQFVCEIIDRLYVISGETSGIPDLVIWNSSSCAVRFVEVKGPGDRLRENQIKVANCIRSLRLDYSVREYRFIRKPIRNSSPERTDVSKGLRAMAGKL